MSALTNSKTKRTPAELLATIETQINALLQPNEQPLTDAEWRAVFMLWDARKLLEYGFVSEAAYVLTKVSR